MPACCQHGVEGAQKGDAGVGWGRRCLCMTAMCWPWCTRMTWRPSSLPARTPPSECTGTTSGPPPLSCFPLCLSVIPAFFCLLAGRCLASIVFACLLVCLSGKRAFLASCLSVCVCVSVCLTCVSVCQSVSACLMFSLCGGCPSVLSCAKLFRLQPVLITLCSCYESSVDMTLHLMVLVFPS